VEVGLGAAINLCAYSFLDSPALAKLLSVVMLFWVGVGVVATFGVSLENERLRSSSWIQIFRGIVPKTLGVVALSTKSQLAHSIIFSLFFGLLFYIAGDLFTASTFVVLVVVYIFYFVSRGLRGLLVC
jgi:hypothetical protein